MAPQDPDELIDPADDDDEGTPQGGEDLTDDQIAELLKGPE